MTFVGLNSKPRDDTKLHDGPDGYTLFFLILELALALYKFILSLKAGSYEQVGWSSNGQNGQKDRLKFILFTKELVWTTIFSASTYVYV